MKQYILVADVRDGDNDTIRIYVTEGGGLSTWQRDAHRYADKSIASYAPFRYVSLVPRRSDD